MLKASGRLRNVFVRGPQMPGPHNCYFFFAASNVRDFRSYGSMPES